MKPIIHRMADGFELASSESGASTQQIGLLGDFFRRVGRLLPSDYLEMQREATEVEILVGDSGCVRFWSPMGVVEMNEAHDLQSYLPSGVAVGDDEGESTYVLMDGLEGDGIYRTSFADPDLGEAVFIAPTFTDLLVRGVGRERLFDWVSGDT